MVIPLVGKVSGELRFPLKLKPLRSKMHLMALLLKRIKEAEVLKWLDNV
jgi:hypothetical protein